LISLTAEALVSDALILFNPHSAIRNKEGSWQ
jgi:hypothetical protein